MKGFTQDTGFVFSFLLSTLVLTMFFPPKTVEKILWLVLTSMIVINSDKVVQFIQSKGEVFKNE